MCYMAMEYVVNNTTRIIGFSNQKFWLKKPNLDRGQKDPLSFWTSKI